MGSDIIIHETIRGLLLILYLSAPVMIAVTLIGLIIGLFQALTSIQEQTLPQSFKFFVAIIAIVLSSGWAGAELAQYTKNIFVLITQM